MKLPTIPGCLQLAVPVYSTAGFPRVFSRSYFGDQWLITRNEAFAPLTYGGICFSKATKTRSV